jgi:hypothetical protein
VLAAHPNLRGVLFDQPHVVRAPRPVLRAAGVLDRCEVVGGSFFESVPEGGERYVLKWIIPRLGGRGAWRDPPTCRAAMGPEAVVLVIERDLGPPNENAVAKLCGPEHARHARGRERTVDEYSRCSTQPVCGSCGPPDDERLSSSSRRGTVTAMVEFTLDGKAVSAPEGELLVHAAARHGTFIPTLCHDEKLDPYGGCRMCVVDVEGAPRPLPACATRVAEGMVVSTNGPITGFQRTLTEMLLSEHLNVSPGRAAERVGRPRERARCRGAVPAPRREAQGVRRPQQAHGLRPGCVHPLRALRPLHAGGHAVLRAVARRARRPRARRADVGARLARHRVRALRRLPVRLPDRRDLREGARGRGRRLRGGR